MDVIEVEVATSILYVLIWWNDRMACTCMYQHNVQTLHQLTTTLMVYGHQRATVKGWTSGDDKWQDTQFANCATVLMLLILSSYLGFKVEKQHHRRFCRMHKKREITDHQNPLQSFQFHWFPHIQTSIHPCFYCGRLWSASFILAM